MQHHKQTIQLSDHVKEKIRSHQPTPYSLSSDELILSDDEDVSIFSISPQKSFRRRSSTFVTYQYNQPLETESFKRIDSKECEECLRRNNLLHKQYQRLLYITDENKKLIEQLNSTILLNHEYQNENLKLKEEIKLLNIHLQQYQINFNLLKEKFLFEKTNQTKQNHEIDQLKRLRHELQIYNQVIAAKQQEEQRQNDYLLQRNWIQKK